MQQDSRESWEEAQGGPGSTWPRLAASVALGIALLLGLGLLVLRLTSHEGVEIVTPVPVAEPTEIKVYVAGAVAAPGVYALKPGDRLEDALLAAGGAAPDADLLAINLAVRLRDQQQVVVPVKKPEAVPTAVAAQSTAPQPVDLNTASAEALQVLPSIGPVRAAAIVRYRDEHGPFASVEALVQVPGIGPKTVADLRGLVVAR